MLYSPFFENVDGFIHGLTNSVHVANLALQLVSADNFHLVVHCFTLVWAIRETKHVAELAHSRSFGVLAGASTPTNTAHQIGIYRDTTRASNMRRRYLTIKIMILKFSYCYTVLYKT